jgi:hypothetical protein
MSDRVGIRMPAILRWLVPSVAVLVTMAPPGGVRAAPAPPQIHVFSCQVMSGSLVPRKDDVGLAVRFRNDGPDTLSSIVWRAKYGEGTVDFIDDGTFSRDIRIDNFVLAEQGSSHFNWGGLALNALALVGRGVPTASMTTTNLVLPQYVSTSDPENCSILRATFEGGETWVNPELGQRTTMLTARTPVPVPSSTAVVAQTDALEPFQFSHCSLIVQLRSIAEVAFRNVSTRVADRVVIRARFGKSGIDFVDQGTFAPDALIKHSLKKPPSDDLRELSYYSLDDPRDCAVVSAHFADGSQWLNPSIDATPGPPPTAPPDGMRFGTVWIRWAPRHGFPTPLPSPSETAAAKP